METQNQEKNLCFGDQDDDDSLKKKISSHALYGLLVETHIDCLKLCLGMADQIEEKSKFDPNAISSRKGDQQELDTFMEAYCMALSKLKEVMKEPHEETMAFIQHMHSQLEEIIEPHQSTTTTPSSS